MFKRWCACAKQVRMNRYMLNSNHEIIVEVYFEVTQLQTTFVSLTISKYRIEDSDIIMYREEYNYIPEINITIGSAASCNGNLYRHFTTCHHYLHTKAITNTPNKPFRTKYK